MGVWRRFFDPILPSGFSLNNSAIVKAVNLAFSSIQSPFIRNIHGRFGTHNSLQSPDIGQNSYYFRFLVKPLIIKNCHKSGTSDDIDINLVPVTKMGKRNMTTSKKLMTGSCRQIMKSSLVFRFMVNSGRMLYDS